MIGPAPTPVKWMPIGRSWRDAASYIFQYFRRPKGSIVRASTNTCTKPGLSPSRFISSAANSPSSHTIVIDARSRGSGSSHLSICQSFTALANAAAYSRLGMSGTAVRQFRIPNSMFQRSSNCSRIKSRSEPGRSPDGGHAS